MKRPSPLQVYYEVWVFIERAELKNPSRRRVYSAGSSKQALAWRACETNQRVFGLAAAAIRSRVSSGGEMRSFPSCIRKIGRGLIRAISLAGEISLPWHPIKNAPIHRAGANRMGPALPRMILN